jgi:signal transduction histidine kinase
VLLASARRSNDLSTLHQTLETAVEQIAEELANLRALITELRPAALDELGLAPALEALFGRVRTLHPLELDAKFELVYAAAVARSCGKPTFCSSRMSMFEPSSAALPAI